MASASAAERTIRRGVIRPWSGAPRYESERYPRARRPRGRVPGHRNADQALRPEPRSAGDRLCRRHAVPEVLCELNALGDRQLAYVKVSGPHAPSLPPETRLCNTTLVVPLTRGRSAASTDDEGHRTCANVLEAQLPAKPGVTTPPRRGRSSRCRVGPAAGSWSP